jgi:iron(III) transport system substrate-binding protein
VAFINHYYLFRALDEHGGEYGADIYFLPGGDPGSLVNVAGAGILDTADHTDAALRFIAFLLSVEAQAYFSTETYEYPLVAGVDPDPRLPALSEIATPDLDLSDLADLAGTLQLLEGTGALE